MKIYKAYKFRMYPEINERCILNSFMGSSRFIYNYYLDKKDKMYNENKLNYNLDDMKKDLKELYKEYPFLNDVDKTLLRTTLEDLDKAYTNFFEGRASHPKFKKKNNHDSYRTNYIKGEYKGKTYGNIKVDLKDKTIKLPKINKIKIRGYRNLKEFDKKIINATISKDANKYYVSVLVEENIENKNLSNSIVGIDLGVSSIITTSDGEKIEKMPNYQKYENKIEKLQQELSKKKTGSNNYYKLKTKIKKVYQKLRNMRKYYIHEVTNKIIDSANIIVVETLKVKEMIIDNCKTLKKNIINTSFSEIIRVLKYKCLWKNKKIININTYYPSSQICSHCGEREKDMKDLSKRKYKCNKCGLELDRDINASVNIMFEGIKELIKKDTLLVK